MAKPNGKLFTVRIDPELADQMPQFEEINWSAVTRKAIEDRIRREKKMIQDMQHNFGGGMVVILFISGILMVVKL